MNDPEKYIFLVDDDPSNIKVLMTVLKFALPNYIIHIATTGNEFLASLEEHPDPDAVILDLRMPDGNGAEVLKQLVDLGKVDVISVIIAITANSEFLRLPTIKASIPLDRQFPRNFKVDDFVAALKRVIADKENRKKANKKQD